MKVLLLSNFFFPEKTGIGVAATDSAQFIRNLGHTVSVVTTMPYYPEWKIHDAYRRKLYVTEDADGIMTTRVWQYVPEQPSTLKRIIHELSGAALMMLAGLFKPADIVFCMSPPLTLGFAAMLLAMLKRKKYWCYVLDIQPDAAIDLGMLSNPVVRRVSFWMERQMYSGADKIPVLSRGMAENLIAKGVPESKIEIIPNSVDVSELNVSGELQDIFRKRYGLENKFLVMYSGNLGIKHNVEIMVECARALRDRDEIYFAIVGEGAAKRSVQTLIERYQLGNIALFPLCERHELGDMLATADILVAPQRKEVKDIVVPSKLLAYLSSGTPVVASVHADSEAARLLTEHDAAMILEPEDTSKLSEAILAIKKDPDGALERAQRGLAMVKALYDRELVKNKYYAPLFGNESKAD